MRIGISLTKEEVDAAIKEYARKKAIDLELAPIKNMKEAFYRADNTAYVEIEIKKDQEEARRSAH